MDARQSDTLSAAWAAGMTFTEALRTLRGCFVPEAAGRLWQQWEREARWAYSRIPATRWQG